MQFGINAPFRGPLATPEAIKKIAQSAEKLGYGYIIVSDHIVVPRKIDSPYPYSESGAFTWLDSGGSGSMEQFTLLTWLAALTSRIRLLSSVAVIPHRNPLVLAKSIATMDVLSAGRMTIGCGAGWMREEFEALGLPPFEARGRVTNEYIEAMKVFWTQDNPRYEGEFVKFDNIDTAPKPVQKPHPPIWIGGESLTALRRVVAMGDGWYPLGKNPNFPLDSVASYRVRVDKLRELAEQAGRDPSAIDLAYNCTFHDGVAQQHKDGGRLSLTGTPEQRAGDIQAFAEIGTRTMIVNVVSNDLQEMLDRMEAFATDVMPLL
ncbi:MAG: LLM class F420-dependent oxidoreductase [Rhodospirillaceae bacterium]|nr:LLM class F420-dependent oxidoreductase [Rhodospirillaceae bacterium]